MMPPKRKQKKIKKETSESTSPVLATTNYREIHLNEVEALRSIYGDDFEDAEARRPAWQVRDKLP